MNFMMKGIYKNRINNQRYTFLSFLPIVLFDQLKYFFNAFFNLISISQLIQYLRVGPMISYLIPFIYVLTTTLIKEAYEDYQRGQRDKEVNEKIYKKVNIFTGTTVDIQS